MRQLPANPVVAVVGATGAVGRVMLQILQERGFPHSEVRAFATSRSAGKQIPFGGSNLTVQEIEESALSSVDLALFDTPDETALEWIPKAVDAGALVVDNSAAWRMEPTVPLVVPEVNPEDIQRHKGIVASPNCTTIGVIVPAFALHKRFGLVKMIVSSYQSVSGAGQAGVEELREQAAKVSHDIDLLGSGEYRGPDPNLFAAPIAFNVIPLVGTPGDQGFTGEEWKLRDESRKITGLPELDVTGTCVRVPTVAGHGSTVHARFAQEVDAAEAHSVLSSAPGVEVVDVPTPLGAAGHDACLVGRIRIDPQDPTCLWFFSASDNLRKGAALNSVQIAELLLPR